MDFEKVIQKILKSDLIYQQALAIVKKNSKGNIWLVGGYLFRNLASELYHLLKPDILDLDFIVEQAREQVEIPLGWEIKVNRFGTKRFIKGNLRIDFITIPAIHSLVRRNLPFSIENYLTGVPLTVQALAYDPTNNKLVGGVGVKALLDKTVSINNQEEAKWYSRELGMTIEEYLKDKADSLGFKAVFN
jgi:hypothetical protein